jgi:hypothetical protein
MLQDLLAARPVGCKTRWLQDPLAVDHAMTSVYVSD